MRSGFNLVLAVCASLTVGCAEPQKPDEKVSLDGIAESTCPDDGPRLEISGKCKGRVINYMDQPETDVAFYEQMTGETCHWEIMELQFATDALVYQGVVCGDNRASLEFSAGAQAAHLYLASSPFGPDLGDLERPLITVFSSDPEAPTANLLFRTREAMEDKEAAARCEVFASPETYGFPADSFVVDVADELKPPLEDGPYAVCGDYGYNGGERNYWRVFGGFSWFFAMGQEPNGIAEQSLILFSQSPEGEWVKLD